MSYKFLFILAVLICCLFAIYACRPAKGKNPVVVHITPAQLDSVLTSSKVQLLDVRTPDEFSEGHIAGAVNINVQDADFLKNAKKAVDKKAPVFIYCRSGKRSMTAATLLARKGYRTINLDGGILAWQADSLPTVK